MIALRFIKVLIVSLCAILGMALSVQAQDTYSPITPQNVGQISQIERIGNGVPRAMAFSPDGSRLAVATTLGVWLIDVPVGARNASPVLFEGQGGAESVTYSPNGSQIAAGGDDNSVMVFDVATGAIVARLENHLYPISAVAWVGKYLASGDWSGVVRLWDTSNWSEYRVLTASSGIGELAFDSQAAQLSAESGTLRLTWDIGSGNVVSQKASTETLADSVTASMDSLRAIYIPETGSINLRENDTPDVTLSGFYGELGSVFFTGDGHVGAAELRPVHLWTISDGQPDNQPENPLSPDGSRLATFGNDGVIHLKDAKTGSEIAGLHGHIRAVTSVAFSPDGRLLVSSSNDGTLQVWDATVTQDSGSLAILKGHDGGVSSVAFNAEGTLIASAGYDGTVRLWGIKS